MYTSEELISVCCIVTHHLVDNADTKTNLILAPIATRYPPPMVQFEIHDVNSKFRWHDGTFDLVHARSVSMAVSDSYI